MKDKLVFDVTDADTIAASDSVGAFLRSSDGTLITHTTVGGKEALDVRVAEGINVEVDLAAADDSVAAWLNDGAGNAISSTGGAIHVSDAGGSLTVDASQLDIDDLNATDDAVAAWLSDGAGTALTSTLVGSDQALDINVVQSINPTLSNTAIATGATTLAADDTAQNIIASPLSGRKEVIVYNNSNKAVFIGESGVSSANGFPLSPGSYLPLKAGSSIDIEFVGADTGQEIRTLELS